MNGIEQGKGSEPTDSSAEQQVQPIVVVTKEETIGSAALTATKASEQVMALDDQAPRSWDLHKSGW